MRSLETAPHTSKLRGRNFFGFMDRQRPGYQTKFAKLVQNPRFFFQYKKKCSCVELFGTIFYVEIPNFKKVQHTKNIKKGADSL